MENTTFYGVPQGPLFVRGDPENGLFWPGGGGGGGGKNSPFGGETNTGVRRGEKWTNENQATGWG